LAKNDLSHTTGTDVEKGEMLHKMADVFGGEDTEMFKKYYATLTEADKAMTIYFGEVGKAGATPLPAELELEKRAEAIAKRDKVSIAKAMEIACTEHPDLYLKQDQEHRMRA